MELGTIIAIVITVVVHLIGIGGFLVWFAAGFPLSIEQFQRWWNDVHFLPEWIRNQNRGQLTRKM